MLISEAADGKKHRDSKYDKYSGKNKRNGKNDSNKKQLPESHVEMDSRLLSALLTVSIWSPKYISWHETLSIVA